MRPIRAARSGGDQISGSLFSYIDLEERVRADHPLRAFRESANARQRGCGSRAAPYNLTLSTYS